ncbi:MAG: ABC transporter permease [Planctomycetes bacterium]|nr:ABC transporter permease [Planctomycetota bacterium]MBT4028002.1 ABC transporter permease [Planctomycetota bacterium]MBT4561108.1 ABC transporter permease [Planctomycetota bacterium]MBT5102227.1 ABC transporter permease [Planctomycetota bacterium]MBT7012193.1 ABC transporter permease [Planctomycetota bacterium]
MIHPLTAIHAPQPLVAASQAQTDLPAYLPPCSDAWLGTDALGHDVLHYCLDALFTAIQVGLGAGLLALFLGAGFGLIAGWRGGKTDALFIWISGVVAAVPGLLSALAIGYMLNGNLLAILLALGLTGWIGLFRLVRTETMRLHGRDWILAAQTSGASQTRLLLRHILPRLRPLLRAQFALQFLYAIQSEIMLQFLGIGTGRPSFGRVLANAWAFDDLGRGAWWPLATATVFLSALVLLARPRTPKQSKSRL